MDEINQFKRNTFFESFQVKRSVWVDMVVELIMQNFREIF